MPRPRRSAWILLAAVVVVAGCAASASPLRLPPGHPADPATPGLTRTVPPSVPGPAAGGAVEPAAPDGYACPMHPEVTSKVPGRCPKCGMDLQPVRAAPPEGGERR